MGSGGVDVGIGLRQPHYRDWAERRPPLGFVEVHSENFFAEGGASLAVLEGVRAHHAVSLHGVGLSLGSAAGVDAWHLARLAQLVDRIEPVRVSDHACFARGPLAPRRGEAGEGDAALRHAADLLPIAFTETQLDILCENVERVQERLRRPLLIENLSAYLSFAGSADTMAEPAFLAELVRRSGCKLLLDVNNLVVNALNAARGAVAGDGVGGHLDGRVGASADLAEERSAVERACAFVDDLPHAAVAEIHLAGYCDTGTLVIDDHGSRVHSPVWPVYRHAIARCGAVPTLIEWDTDLPALDVLLEEASIAAGAQRETLDSAGRAAEPWPHAARVAVEGLRATRAGR